MPNPKPNLSPIAKKIYDTVVDALESAEETGGPEGDEYIALMEAVAALGTRRATWAQEDMSPVLSATAEAARKGAEAGDRDARDCYEEEDGLERLRGSLEPSAESWETAARNANAAACDGIPTAEVEVYYRAYEQAARRRVSILIGKAEVSR